MMWRWSVVEGNLKRIPAEIDIDKSPFVSIHQLCEKHKFCKIFMNDIVELEITKGYLVLGTKMESVFTKCMTSSPCNEKLCSSLMLTNFCAFNLCDSIIKIPIY